MTQMVDDENTIIKNIKRSYKRRYHHYEQLWRPGKLQSLFDVDGEKVRDCFGLVHLLCHLLSPDNQKLTSAIAGDKPDSWLRVFFIINYFTSVHYWQDLWPCSVLLFSAPEFSSSSITSHQFITGNFTQLSYLKISSRNQK